MEIDARTVVCLLLKGKSFYKTTQFGDPVYLGDPLNIVRIFNEKEADELCILDIEASRTGEPPMFDFLARLAGECFMPISYGGGIRTVEDCRRLIGIGFEKVVINSRLDEAPEILSEVADRFGSQAVIASIDVRRDDQGKATVWTYGGTRQTGADPTSYARQAEALGAGEILLTSIDRDGTRAGYDLDLIRSVTEAVQVPVIACGGADSLEGLAAAVLDGKASGAAAGSLFVFYGPRRAVLLNPPTYEEFQAALASGMAARGVSAT